ncbi:hypothetical protein GCM10010464_30910 [Pseudonocardia yunnanensis]|uniref:Uncharacterized protein n=1 Tax=Pseudonocardia yunnanensis TaxID=58107 RepID=A0ABW4ETH0_9PSEU
MSNGTAGSLAAGPPHSSGGAGAQVCVLLACFAGRKQAAKIRRQLDKRIGQSGDAILDQVIVKINARHKALVHHPRRTLAGILTPALTWGVFGLLAGGLKGLGVWAVIGAVCGGLFAYYFEHALTKDELTRIGSRLPANSSAIVAFVHGSDPQRILSSAAGYQPATASVAAITTDLTAQVYRDAAQLAETSATRAGAAPATAGDQPAELSMLLVRFVGERAARQAVADPSTATRQDQKAPQVELVIETNEHGRRRVINPNTGAATFSKGAAIGWGLSGLAWGVIVGFAGDGGVLGAAESGLVTGMLWAVLGLAAGALYGLWAGRSVSARRLRGLDPILPPDTSLVVAWAEGSPGRHTIERWARSASQRLILRFTPVAHGAVLEV